MDIHDWLTKTEKKGSTDIVSNYFLRRPAVSNFYIWASIFGRDCDYLTWRYSYGCNNRIGDYWLHYTFGWCLLSLFNLGN